MSIEQTQETAAEYRYLWNRNYYGFNGDKDFEICKESVNELLSNPALSHRTFEDLEHIKNFTKIAFLLLKKEEEVWGTNTLEYLEKIYNLNIYGAKKLDLKGGYQLINDNGIRISPKYKLEIHFLEHAATIADLAVNYCIKTYQPPYLIADWNDKSVVARNISLSRIFRDLDSINLNFNKMPPQLSYEVINEMLSMARRLEESMYNLTNIMHDKALISYSSNLMEAQELIAETYETKIRSFKFSRKLWDMFRLDLTSKDDDNLNLERIELFQKVFTTIVISAGEILIMPLYSDLNIGKENIDGEITNVVKFMRGLVNTVPVKTGSIKSKSLKKTAHALASDFFTTFIEIEKTYNRDLRPRAKTAGLDFENSPYLNTDLYRTFKELERRFSQYE
jgi:flagellar biosynthesis regulator FlaF